MFISVKRCPLWCYIDDQIQGFLLALFSESVIGQFLNLIHNGPDPTCKNGRAELPTLQATQTLSLLRWHSWHDNYVVNLLSTPHSGVTSKIICLRDSHNWSKNNSCKVWHLLKSNALVIRPVLSLWLPFYWDNKKTI